MTEDNDEGSKHDKPLYSFQFPDPFVRDGKGSLSKSFTQTHMSIIQLLEPKLILDIYAKSMAQSPRKILYNHFQLEMHQLMTTPYFIKQMKLHNALVFRFRMDREGRAQGLF